MKRLCLTSLVLALFSLVCHAAEFYTGAYYITKAPLLVAREAGQFDLTVNDNKTVAIQCYYNSGPSISLTGSWTTVRGKIKISASTTIPSTGLGPGLVFFNGYARSGFANGTFLIRADGVFRGKWQATFP